MTRDQTREGRDGPSAAPQDRLAAAREVIRLEARTISALEELLDGSFLAAVDRILACRGLVVVSGMGKAGLIGEKISATLSSTGTPSIALHPTEALHGDLGRVRADDVVIVLSNSGETAEIRNLIPHLKRIGAPVIGMTGAPDSSLGRLSDCVLDIGRVDEARPLGLAPTASTSAMLALGDALAMVVLEERGFSREDYARFHPAGSLGRRLMRVRDVMRQGDELPLVAPSASVARVLQTMSGTAGRPGAALVVGDDRRLVGIFTDGDFRRLLESGDRSRLDEPVSEFMGKNPKSVSAEALVDEAEQLVRTHRIDQIAVVDDEGHAIGLLDVQDLLNTRL